MSKMNIVLAVVMLFFNLSVLAKIEIVHHPEPKKPLYLASAIYSVFKKELPVLPSKDSA